MAFNFLPSRDRLERIGSTTKTWLKGHFYDLVVKNLTASSVVTVDSTGLLKSDANLVVPTTQRSGSVQAALSTISVVSYGTFAVMTTSLALVSIQAQMAEVRATLVSFGLWKGA